MLDIPAARLASTRACRGGKTLAHDHARPGEAHGYPPRGSRFLLIVFAGIWLAAAHILAFKFATARTIVAGVTLALAGVLLIIATR
jgi:hypothetical protein